MTKKMTGIRLDKHLSEKFPQYSRAFLKSQINAGNILVNNKIKKPSYILKESDQLEINITKPQKSALEPNPDIKLNIIYEDENIIVIDKPAGISVHPAKLDNEQAQLAHPSKAGQNNTIANALLAYYPAIADVGDPSTSSGQAQIRPGIVHRLDKNTSGLMVVAKNQKHFDWIKEQFSQRKVIKKYLALVTGNIKEKNGVIAKPIGKTKDFRKRTTIPFKKQKEAVTHYRVLERFLFSCHPELGSGYQKMPKQIRHDKSRHYTLLEAEPKTGRTHQIRVHLASISHPIANDALYGFKRQALLPGLKRQFLHASYLKFLLPNGKLLELTSDLPDDLNLCLQNLKSSIKNK